MDNQEQFSNVDIGTVKRRKRLGFAVATFTIIGIISVIIACVNFVAYMTDDTDKKLEYANRLSTMVMLDPLAFDSLEEANITVLRQAIIWQTIMSEDIELYEHDDTGSLMLPILDIDKHALELFGPNFKLTHETFEDKAQGLTFLFDEESQCYIIPATGQVGNYTPVVDEIKHVGGNLRVTVGYLPPANSNSDILNTQTVSESSKYMDYMFTKIDKGYYLYALYESEKKPELTAQETSSEVIVEEDINSLVENAANGDKIAAENEIEAAKEASSSQSTANSEDTAE